MTVVEYIDLAEDEYYVKVDFVDLSTEEDSVEKDGNAEEDANVPQSENLAEAAASSPSNSEQDATVTTSLPTVGHGAATSSVMAEEAQPENQEVLATSDVAKEAMQSENHDLTTIADCVGEVEQYDHEAQSVVFSSGQLCQIIGRAHVVGDDLDLDISNGGDHPHGEPGSSTVQEDLDLYNLHAKEKPEGDTEKKEKCDVFAMSQSPEDKEKEINRFRKFYERKGNQQVNTSATRCYRQLGILHTKGVPPTLHSGDSEFSVMGNIHNGTTSIGTNIAYVGEVLVSTYQGCSKTSQGNTIYGRVSHNGPECCMVKGCTNGAHGSTSLCIFHNSRPHKRCCAVIGCTKGACTSSQGCTDRCIKHGGGKRCKYDGCGKGAIGKTDYCIAHGGGRRCKSEGCRKGAQGKTDNCIEHGGGIRCKFLGCRASATYMKDFCSMHRTSVLSGNNSSHEILQARRAKKAEPSRGRNSCSVIGGRAQKRQNTSFNAIETEEEKGRGFVCQNNMLKAQQTTHGMNSESGLAEGSPPRKFRKLAEVYT